MLPHDSTFIFLVKYYKVAVLTLIKKMECKISIESELVTNIPISYNH